MSMNILISISFGEGRDYDFDVEPSTTIEELKQLLGEKMAPRDIDNMWLVLDDEQLYDESTLADYDIKANTILKLIDPRDVGRNIRGLIGVKFINVNDDQAITRNEWSAEAPRWRRARPGMCVEGLCTNPACVANNQMVVIPLGYRTFNLITDRVGVTKCPLCKQFVRINTCAFSNCWWKYHGVQEPENGPPQSYSCDWKRADDAYHRFNEANGDIVSWSELVFEVVKDKPAGTQNNAMDVAMDNAVENDTTLRSLAGQS
jgi:hypothetical protein